MTAPFLELKGIAKQFTGHAAVRDLSLTVPRGSVLALLGPSGSGKTTTLRILAGFEEPDAGVVLLDGRDITRLAPAARRFGMVFQHYALFPHLTVGENVAVGLHDRPDRAERVRTLLGLVDLTGFAHRTIDALSGGQQQRVALARALAPEPRLLLLDEPLSNLDPSLRERTRRELRAALAKVGITTVLVTHEQEEAFALGDLVAVLREGRLEQVGTGPDLYERPATLFVATFVGRGTVLPGVMRDPQHARVAAGAEWPVRCPTPLAPDAAVSLVARPEALRFATDRGLAGTVQERRYLGGRALFQVGTAAGVLEVEAAVDAARPGDVVRVAAVFAHAFPAEPA
jgi:ABC-type Fe3+/spermidine/putrescine transport system ATPase subunit